MAGYEIVDVSGVKSFLKKGAKKVGRGAKGVAKGAKKVVGKGVNAATSPLGIALLTATGAGAGTIVAAKVYAAARKGDPKAKKALVEVQTMAKAGDPKAKAAVANVNAVAATSGVYRNRYRQGINAGKVA